MIKSLSDEELVIPSDEGHIPLYHAAKKNCVQIVKLLLDRTAAVINSTQLIIHTYCKETDVSDGNKEIVKLLLLSTNNPDAVTQISDCEDIYMTPLSAAIFEQNIEIVSLLMNKLTDEQIIEVCDKQLMSPSYVLSTIEIFNLFVYRLPIESFFKASNSFNMAPLYLASHFNKIEITKILVNILPTDRLMIPDKLGMTALHKACYQKNIEICQILIDKISPKQMVIQDRVGRTPLHVAFQRHRPSIINMFLSILNNKDLYIMDNAGKLPMDYAIMK